MLQIASVSKNNSLCNEHRVKSRETLRYRRFDRVLYAAQSLFARDVWVSGSSIARELNIPRDTVTGWTLCEGTQIRFLISRYQLLQRSLGLKASGGTNGTEF